MQTRADYWLPDNLGSRFLAEAKRLLELEQRVGRLTSVQAAVIINLTCNANGIDDLSWSYLYQAVEMARQLDLFAVIPEASQEEQVASATTAWCLFNCQA